MSRQQMAVAEMSEAEADSLFNRIAQLEIRRTERKAKYEARIAKIKEAYELADADDAAQLGADVARLEAYIRAHPERFTRPKSRVTDMGSYGLRKSTRTEWDDEELLVEHLLNLGYLECVEIKRKPVTAAITTRLEAGEEIEGVSRESKDRPGYTIDAALKKAAKESAA